MDSSYSGNVNWGPYKFTYAPATPENPVRGGMTLSCTYKSKTFTKVVKIHDPKEVLSNSIGAAQAIRRELSAPMYDCLEEGHFIADKIIRDRYIHALGQSQKFCEVKYTDGSVGFDWLPLDWKPPTKA